LFSVGGVEYEITPVDPAGAKSWTTGGVRYEVKGLFTSALHPRDGHGRFVRVGGTVHLPGGGTGTVSAIGDGKKKGKNGVVIPRGHVEVTKAGAGSVVVTPGKLSVASPKKPAAKLPPARPAPPGPATPAGITVGDRIHSWTSARGGPAIGMGDRTVVSVVPKKVGKRDAFHVTFSDGVEVDLPADATIGHAAEPGDGKVSLPAGHRVTMPDGTHGRVVDVDHGKVNVEVAVPGDGPRTVTVPVAAVAVVHRTGAKGDAVKGDPTEMSQEEYATHLTRVEAVLDQAVEDGQTTDQLHTVGKDEKGRDVYTKARVEQHQRIIDKVTRGWDEVPNGGRAVIAGGLGGAGKSTVLGKYAGIDQSQYATLNPDDVKELMAEAGMIPDVSGLSPMEASALVHEESSHIVGILAEMAYRQKKNVIWDITMSGQDSVQKRIDDLRASGYGFINGVFVDIPVETSVVRALGRHRRGAEQYRAGEGAGGRFVPPHIIRKNNPTPGSTAQSRNREVFDAQRVQFNSWSVYDNSGTAPVLTMTGIGAETGQPPPFGAG
jgi:hypothetical protein